MCISMLQSGLCNLLWKTFWRRSCAGMLLWHISGIIYELLLTSLIFFHFLSSPNESVMPQSWPGSTCGYKKKRNFLSPVENWVPPGGKGPLDLYLTWERCWVYVMQVMQFNHNLYQILWFNMTSVTISTQHHFFACFFAILKINLETI